MNKKKMYKTKDRAMGDAYKVTANGKTIIILCEHGIAAITRIYGKHTRPKITKLSNIQADCFSSDYDVYRLNRVFKDDDDITYTYEELFAEWSKPENTDIREEYEYDFIQWLYDCTHGNGALREV